MNFIQFEAVEENLEGGQPLDFSVEDEDDQVIDEIDFIDDNEHQKEDVSFYRNIDLNDIDKYNKFSNQAKDPRSAIFEDGEIFFGVNDTQPLLHVPKNREVVDFDFFEKSEKSVFNFKKTLQNFERSKNSFFNLIVYALMSKKKRRKSKNQKEKNLKKLLEKKFTRSYLK